MVAAVTGEEASCDPVVSARGVVTRSDSDRPDVRAMPDKRCDPEAETAAEPAAAEWPPAADHPAEPGYSDDGFSPDADYADAGFTAAADYSDAGFLAAEPQLAGPALAESPAAEAEMTAAEAQIPLTTEASATAAPTTSAAATRATEAQAPATEAPATEAPATEAPPSSAQPGLSGQLARLRAQVDRLRQPRDPDRPRGSGARLLRYGRRSIGPVAFVVLGILLYTAYLAQARSIPATSEGGGQALQAWNMLHGNFLLSGWTMSDVSFYTTELPEYMLVEWSTG